MLELETFSDQLRRLDEDAFARVGAWKDEHSTYGCEAQEFLVNIAPLQQTWAWENDRRLLASEKSATVAVEQARRFGPDEIVRSASAFAA